MSESLHSATHDLKTVQPYFDGVWIGSKSFEVRINDRGFVVGDILCLREYSSTTGYSGRWVRYGVRYLLADFPGLQPGYVAMGLQLIDRSSTPALLRLWCMFRWGWSYGRARACHKESFS